MLLPDTVLPDGLSAEEQREACRALKGSLLRQEVYALDGTPSAAFPVTVSERSYAVRRLQPRANDRYAVFLVHPGETIDYHYERNSGRSARCSRATLEVDRSATCSNPPPSPTGAAGPTRILRARSRRRRRKS